MALSTKRLVIKAEQVHAHPSYHCLASRRNSENEIFGRKRADVFHINFMYRNICDMHQAPQEAQLWLLCHLRATGTSENRIFGGSFLLADRFLHFVPFTSLLQRQDTMGRCRLVERILRKASSRNRQRELSMFNIAIMGKGDIKHRRGKFQFFEPFD